MRDAKSLPVRVLRASDFPAGPPLGPGVCGLDEAGRGPLAGPVYAAACVLPADFPLDCLDDSKALSEKRREAAFGIIVDRSLAWAIDWATPFEIDTINILEASMLAMRRAYASVAALLAAAGRDGGPETVFVDGNRDPRLGRPAHPVVKGDAIVPAIMAASILAKVSRDRFMQRLHDAHPEYGFDQHKGYGTPAHLAALRNHGPCPQHRRSFAPVRACLEPALSSLPA